MERDSGKLTMPERISILTAESRAKEIFDEFKDFEISYENYKEFFARYKQAYFDLTAIINEINWDIAQEYRFLPEFGATMGAVLGQKENLSNALLEEKMMKMWTMQKSDFIEKLKRMMPIEAKVITLRAILDDIQFDAVKKSYEMLEQEPVREKLAIIRPSGIGQMVAGLWLQGKTSVEIAHDHPEWGIEATHMKRYAERGAESLIREGKLTIEEAERHRLRVFVDNKLVKHVTETVKLEDKLDTNEKNVEADLPT